MTRIILGDIAIVSRPASTPPQRPQAHSHGQVRTVSLEEARAAADFPVLQPTYRPSLGLALTRVDLLLTAGQGEPQVARVVSQFREGPGRWLVLRQIGLGAFGMPPHEVGVPYTMREGQIGDRVAAFFAHPVAAAELPGGQLTITHCVWERDGCLLELQAPHLTPEELARVAESLR